MEYYIVDSKGERHEKIIERNQNKCYLELQDYNDSITFKRITYSRPKLSDEISYPNDTVEQFNYIDYRIYNIRSKLFRYCL